MALTRESLIEAATLLAQAGDIGAAVAALRNRLAGLRISVVDAFDMRHEKPAFSVGTYQVFLVSSDGHCWTTTHDATRADGMLLADTVN